VIKLYQFPPTWGLPNASPFCMKLETYLRMAGLPYQTVSTLDLRKAPKGRLPYIEDDGKKIADSSFIIDHLKGSYGDSLDAHLGRYQEGIALAMRHLLEDSLYWCLLYSRWVDEANWEKTKSAYFAMLPAPLRMIVPAMARKQVLKSLQLQGTGDHTAEEVYALGKADVAALSDFLGNKPYFMGDRPTSLDAAAHAFLANILWVPVASPLQEHAKQFTNLAAYCQRMREKFYNGYASNKEYDDEK